MNYEDQVTKEYLENAIANAGVKIVTGSYTGDGAATRTINLGFTPRAVYVGGPHGLTYYCAINFHAYYGGLALADSPLQYDNRDIVAIVNNGFRVTYYSPDSQQKIWSNMSNSVYNYIAIA